MESLKYADFSPKMGSEICEFVGKAGIRNIVFAKKKIGSKSLGLVDAVGFAFSHLERSVEGI